MYLISLHEAGLNLHTPPKMNESFDFKGLMDQIIESLCTFYFLWKKRKRLKIHTHKIKIFKLYALVYFLKLST